MNYTHYIRVAIEGEYNKKDLVIIKEHLSKIDSDNFIGTEMHCNPTFYECGRFGLLSIARPELKFIFYHFGDDYTYLEITKYQNRLLLESNAFTIRSQTNLKLFGIDPYDCGKFNVHIDIENDVTSYINGTNSLDEISNNISEDTSEDTSIEY